MIIGFTGTREGMSDAQCTKLHKVLNELKCTEFHHGDCVGADSQAAYLVRSMAGIKIVCHPPSNSRLRAHVPIRDMDEVLPTQPYRVRNQAIVNACDHLVVGPKNNLEARRSGTWGTYRYAQRRGKPTTILKR